MVRTRAEGSVKVAAAKAPRKVFSSSSAGGSSSSSSSSSTTPSKGSKYGGGNSYKPQPVPEWQKGIGSFFKPQEDSQRASRAEDGQGSSSEVGEGSGVGRVCDMEQGEGSGMGSDVREEGEGSGVGSDVREEGEGSGVMDVSPSASSPSSPPKNGIISDGDD